MSNGTEQVNPPPDHSKSRKRSAPLDSWLPDGWRVEDKVRTSGATAGSVDKVYMKSLNLLLLRRSSKLFTLKIL